MRRVAREEEPTVLHRLDHEAAHADDPLLEHGALVQRPPRQRRTRLELLPDAFVGPLVEPVVGAALHVVTRELRRPQREQREAALVVRVHELVDRRSDVGEDAEPRERILALERAEDAGGNARAADAVKAVAACDDVALELLRDALVREPNARPLAVELVHAHAVDVEEQRQTARQPRSDEVLHDLGLTVDDDRPSTAQLGQRHVMPLAVELKIDAVVDDPFAIHPLADTGFAQQLDRPLLEHAGADPVLDVLATPVLEDDALDARDLEQPRERQPCRPRPDDADLCPQSR